MSVRVRREVDIEYLTLEQPGSDEPCHLRYGDVIPEWATPDQIQPLIRSGAIAEFGEL